MPLKQFVIENVNVVHQGHIELFSFVLPASDLLGIAAILRFGEDPRGVNRELTPNRVKEILDWMKKTTDPVMADSIKGCLYGNDGCQWVYDPVNKTLTGDVETDPQRKTEGCHYAVDDGQHRIGALEMMGGDDRKRWELSIIAGCEMEVEDRIRLFLQAEKRRAVSGRLQYEMMDRINQFPNETTRDAYRMARHLNEATGSPMKGVIYFDQGPKIPKHKVSVTSLLGPLKHSVGRRSRLHPYENEQQRQAMLNLFIASSLLWSSQWGQPERTLGHRLGYLTLITIIAKSGNLHALLGGDLSLNSFKRTLDHARAFKWDPPGVKDGSIGFIKLAQLFDDYLGQKIVDAQVQGRKVV